ncbi:TolC family protein [Pikeienuella piscinae]|uniref:TolC family protein n=1 Tax=Pikeienuella piscinae TaxID=2748098 RepID=A0A7L5BW00_9RHOB|nr:TolC family protein [Pikeienuella piscinae]QIE56045.1 TolC family protein [Pikeienuella piscinae]
MSQPQGDGANIVELDVNDLLDRMLARSNQLKAFSDLPLIREAVVREAEDRCDTFIFGEADVRTADDIRSSTLEPGTSGSAPDNLEEDEFGIEVGLRQPLITGGEVRLSQRFGGRDSNSEFFVPDDQAESEIRLELRQPLLEGAGVTVNSAPIQLAQLERDRSGAELQRQIDTQMLEALRTYWALYSERSRVLQRQRLIADLGGISARLSSRAGFNALPGETAQARAALRKAEAALIRARAGVDNSEARLAALLSDGSLYRRDIEIIPAQPVMVEFIDAPLDDVSILALENRPEVKVVALELRGAEIRTEVARNRLLPDLDLFASASSAGLQGDYDFDRAFGKQFGQTGIDAAVGVRFEIPIGNTTDKARYDRRRVEARQLTSRLRNVSDSVLLETQVAVREVRTSYEEMRAREAELSAINSELSALRSLAVNGAEGGSAFLATLISSYEDRANAGERPMLSAVSYTPALYTLENVAGTMLSVRDIRAERVNTNNLDYIRLVRGNVPPPPGESVSPDILTDPDAILDASTIPNAVDDAAPEAE